MYWAMHVWWVYGTHTRRNSFWHPCLHIQARKGVVEDNNDESVMCSTLVDSSGSVYIPSATPGGHASFRLTSPHRCCCCDSAADDDDEMLMMMLMMMMLYSNGPCPRDFCVRRQTRNRRRCSVSVHVHRRMRAQSASNGTSRRCAARCDVFV